MVTRADRFTQTSRTTEYFSDFLDSFAVSPVTGSLAKTVNDKAVRQAVKNLVMTNMGERFFQPKLGADVYKILFEPNTLLTSAMLKTNIEATIRRYEPRARDIAIQVLPTNDEHYLDINIIFYVINNPDPIDITLNLKRVR